MEIGEVIRQIRKTRELTLEEVADKIGADTGNLSRVERGLQNHTPEMIEKLAAVFGVKVSTMYAIAEGGEMPALPAYTPDQQQVLALWEWLSPKQQQEWKDKMEEEAASNRELFERMSAKSHHKMPTTAVTAGPPAAHAKKTGHRKTGS